MNIKRIKLADVKPAAYNPRRQLKPGEKEYEALKASISRVGGHQRLAVLQHLGYTSAEVSVVDLDEKEEKLLIIIAREKGFVTFSDVMESINKYFDFPWVGACGYNIGSNKARALLYDTTMAQWLRSNWNDTKKGTSPARAYGGVLVPDGKDENGDVIYRYAIKR